MEKLFAELQAIHPMSDGLKDFLLEHMVARELKKNDLLLKFGQVCQHIYFIESGLFRCFYKRGSQHVSSWFMSDGDMLISVESFFGQLPSKEAIQALEKSIVHYISYAQLQRAYNEFPEFNIHGRILTEKYYIKSENKGMAIRTTTSQERFQHLVENHPEYLTRIPGKYLASYLGMSAYTFSRAQTQINLAN